jgi:prepilin-type N-terminal cleavage/methylation domain-containing protein
MKKEKTVREKNYLSSDNSGFSLVELLVSILIMSVVTGIVVTLISSSRIAYTEVKAEAVVQEESETVRTFINEIAIEARDCGKALVGSSGDHCIWFYAPDNESDNKSNYCYYFILCETSNRVLRYKKYPNTITSPSAGLDYEALLVTNESTKVAGDPYSLLAEHVNGIDLSKVLSGDATHNTGSLITVNLLMDFAEDDYNKHFVFDGRNIISE